MKIGVLIVALVLALTAFLAALQVWEQTVAIFTVWTVAIIVGIVLVAKTARSLLLFFRGLPGRTSALAAELSIRDLAVAVLKRTRQERWFPGISPGIRRPFGRPPFTIGFT